MNTTTNNDENNNNNNEQQNANTTIKNLRRDVTCIHCGHNFVKFEYMSGTVFWMISSQKSYEMIKCLFI
jgi:hypothetical protein